MESKSVLPWVAGGCGCLLLLIALGGVGAFLYMKRQETHGEESSPSPEHAEGETAAPATIPRVLSARVTQVDGSVPVQVGAICGFAVERHERENAEPWCRSQILCGSTVLYGAGATNGYYPCTLSASPRLATGSDPETTEQDSDPAMEFNTQTGQLTIRDDATGPHGAYTVTAELSIVE